MNAAAGAVCQAMTFRGPTTTIASGGASAILGLDCALAFIRTGQADRVVLIATDELCEAVVAEHAKRGVLASDGVMRPYDDARSGTVLGAAAVAIVLEAADPVASRGGRAYCEVAGVAHLGCDNRPQAARPTVERVLRRVLDVAAHAPADVRYCAGAGAGTAHDLAELAALDSVFGEDLLLSAPKSLTGECAAGSGGVSLLVAALAVSEGLVPATANLSSPVAGFPLRHVTRPMQGEDVRSAIANAASPLSAFGTALLTST
jgi:3-oxoacyl-[acyl-carrier-protein] synthase II